MELELLPEIERGCGKRVAGGIYAECPTSKNGKPIEWFLCDPVIPIDLVEFGLTPRNQVLVNYSTGPHIMDWLGGQHWPNPADWIEEVRRFGMSQRVELKDYSKLSKKTLMLLVHPKGYIENELYSGAWKSLAEHTVDMSQYYSWSYCPFISDGADEEVHPKNWKNGYCAGHHWRTVTGGEMPVGEEPSNSPERFKVRKMPSFQYFAYSAADEYNFQPGMIAILPVRQFALVNDPLGDMEDKIHLLEKSPIPYHITES